MHADIENATSPSLAPRIVERQKRGETTRVYTSRMADQREEDLRTLKLLRGRPATVDDALELADRFGSGGWVMAGA